MRSKLVTESQIRVHQKNLIAIEFIRAFTLIVLAGLIMVFDGIILITASMEGGSVIIKKESPPLSSPKTSDCIPGEGHSHNLDCFK